MWKLVIEDDEGKRTVVPLTRDDYTIGRKEGNTIRLTERNVSREHAKIKKANGAANGQQSPFTLEDLTSYNGVYVNGLRVAAPQDLLHGDLIQIGDYRIILQDDAMVEDAASGAITAATTQDMKSTMPTGAVNRGSLLMERPNRLVMLAGPTPGAEYPLDRERSTIGRAEDATISVNHNSVSRLHCEVHALGESRFEIVDKGSSNGVRVNGSDLRRGIVEAGDVIELGDVRFRFVGAGQIFLPGVGDSQQLEAISDRPPSSVRSDDKVRASGGSLLPWILVGALVAAVAVGGFAFWQKSQGTGSPTVPTGTDDPEALALAAAKKLCDQGKCDVAHDKIMVEIGEHSPLRQSSDFQTIETRWADSMLERAEKEADLTKKRALLRQVEQAASVPASRRGIATNKLQELDAAPAGSKVNQLPTVSATGTTTASAPSARTTATVPTGTTTVTAPTGTGTGTVPTATASVKKPPTGGSVADQARAMLLTDKAGARALLEPRVFGRKATDEEAAMLYGICKEQRDTTCKTTIKEHYPNVH